MHFQEVLWQTRFLRKIYKRRHFYGDIIEIVMEKTNYLTLSAMAEFLTTGCLKGTKEVMNSCLEIIRELGFPMEKIFNPKMANNAGSSRRTCLHRDCVEEVFVWNYVDHFVEHTKEYCEELCDNPTSFACQFANCAINITFDDELEPMLKKREIQKHFETHLHGVAKDLHNQNGFQVENIEHYLTILETQCTGTFEEPSTETSQAPPDGDTNATITNQFQTDLDGKNDNTFQPPSLDDVNEQETQDHGNNEYDNDVGDLFSSDEEDSNTNMDSSKALAEQNTNIVVNENLPLATINHGNPDPINDDIPAADANFPAIPTTSAQVPRVPPLKFARDRLQMPNSQNRGTKRPADNSSNAENIPKEKKPKKKKPKKACKLCRMAVAGEKPRKNHFYAHFNILDTPEQHLVKDSVDQLNVICGLCDVTNSVKQRKKLQNHIFEKHSEVFDRVLDHILKTTPHKLQNIEIRENSSFNVEDDGFGPFIIEN